MPTPVKLLRPLLAGLLACGPLLAGADERGARLYQEHCAVCHGERGDGDSRAARSLKPPPRDFTRADPRRLHREAMIAAVTHGRPGTAMQPFAGRLSQAEIEAVVDYIRRRFMGQGETPAVPPPADRGEALYQRHCAVCHGDRGDVAMWARHGLKPPPRDFTRADPRRLHREAMIAAVTHGRPGTAMQPFAGRLSQAEIEAVVDFIRRRFMGVADTAPAPVAAHDRYPGGLEGDARRGEAIYQGQCYVCHGREGRGDGPRAGFIRPPPRDFTSAESRARFRRAALYRAIERGKRGTVMPAWGKVLEPQAIADVAEYVYTRFIRPPRPAAQEAEAEAEEPEPEPDGRALYDRHCYFCHGYDGDARTLAASYLDPPPRDFTRADPARLTEAAIVQTLREGRLGTAMQSFAGRLSEAEMHAVARYVRRRFVEAKAPAGDYHTPENGWPDHQRYRIAYPFALGEIPLDRPLEALTPEQRAGRALYLQACISCHDRGRVDDPGPPWQPRPLSYPRNGYDHRRPDQVSGASPYAVHDRAPVLTAATPQERQGERLYQANCAFCHAADGSGRNWIGAFIEPHPRDLRDPALAALSDDELAARIARGVPGSAMPAWGRVLTKEEIRAVVAYLRKAFLK